MSERDGGGGAPRLDGLEAEFDIGRELGRGGSAVVYLALERELGRPVAIKVIRPGYAQAEEAVARLEREARTLARLQHPNIVSLYGTRRLGDGGIALIMQYMAGCTLKEWIRAKGACDFDETTRILAEIARALAYAHRRRIVHRDIKPENIYLDAEAGVARLSDFGIARVWDTESSLTVTGLAIGTPAYMSPEQIDGSELDGRSDLYSLGLVGHEMLTGRRPWADQNLYGIIYKQKHEALASLAELRPGIPDRLRLAIEGALEKDPAARWATADDMLAQLLSADDARAGAAAPGTAAAAAAAAEEPAVDDAPTMLYRRPGADEPAAEDAPAAAAAPEEPAAPEPEPEPEAEPDAAQVLASLQIFEDEYDDEREAHARRGGTRKRSRALMIVAGVAVVLVAGTVAAIAALRPGRPAGGAWSAVPAGGGASAAGVDGEVRGAAAALSGPAAPPAPAADPAAGAPDRIVALVDSMLRGPAGGPVPAPLEVRVEDAQGRPVPNAAVEFQVMAGGGFVAPTVTTTGTDGLARASWTLGAAAGSNVAVATVAGIVGTAAVFRADARVAGVPHLVVLKGADQQGDPGARLPDDIAVRVEDGSGRAVPNAVVRFRVLAGGGSVDRPAARTDADGMARTGWKLGTVEGRNVLVAQAEGLDAPPIRIDARTAGARLAVRPEIAAGGTHTCELNEQGQPVCWGSNARGQLGGASARRDGEPVRVASPRRFASLAAGTSHTCGLATTGEAFCWGANDSGQLGDGTTRPSAKPTPVAGRRRFTAVAAGASHTCALATGGAAYCWGANDDGQLGDGSRGARSAPVAVSSATAFRSLVPGWSHTCAVSIDDEAFCWGNNDHGQLGDGTTSDRLAPARVAGGLHFSALTAGSAHTCGITGAGAVYCWGRNTYGQLGSGDAADRDQPAKVDFNGAFVRVSAGGVHTCALTAYGDAYCWGRNVYGQLGDGTTTERSQPTLVVGGLRFASIRTSGSHTCGTTVSGEDYCWGYNADGQLGDGTKTNQARPVRVLRR
ncbi:MAG TPA: protein kinase [Longimicrobiales bacterium]|nr:protein kinase [Longimicrobiales bacterium]